MDGGTVTDIDGIMVWLRETMDAATRRAEAAATETGSAEWEYRAAQFTHFTLNATSSPGFMVADVDYLDPAPGKFMADNDPAAVLRRIAADRKMLDLHAPVTVEYEDDSPTTLACRTCGSHFEYPTRWPCTTLRLLAEGYGWTKETT